MRNSGKPWEEMIQTSADVYERQGFLRLSKVDPPTKMVGPGRVIWLKNPFLDFVGSWTERQGRALMLEAKSTKDPTLKLRQKDNGVTEDQLWAIDRWHRSGAVTGVLWHVRDKAMYYLSPMALASALIEGRRNVGVDDGVRFTQGVGMVLADFLPALDAVWAVK